MSNEDPSLDLTICGEYAEFLAAEMQRLDLSATEVVQRALGLYCVIAASVEDGEQLVIQRLIDDTDLPPVVRIDYYQAPDPIGDLSVKIEVEPARRLRAEIAVWPLFF